MQSDFNSTFLARVSSVSLGAGRVICSIANSPADLAQAATLGNVMDNGLRVTVYFVGDNEPVTSFLAQLPKIQRNLQFNSNGGSLHLDVPETDRRAMASLIGCENTIRMEVVIDEGKGAQTKGKNLKLVEKSPSPFGAFWQYLDSKNFLANPDLGEMFTDLADVHKTIDRKEIIRRCFGGRRSEKVSPEMLEKWVHDRGVDIRSSVYSMIRNGKAFAGRKAA